jgi:methyltransferase
VRSDASLIWFTAVVAAVALERVAELLVSMRNAAWSMERGGIEVGRRHYAFMVVLHTGLLVAVVTEAWVRRPSFIPVLGWTMVGVVAVAQALRWWCIRTLGHQWNTRVIVVPGMPSVTSGPYRWMSHPNYVAVVAEGVALPLVHTAWITAVVFGVLNAAVLSVRIRVENHALGALDRPLRSAA